MNLSKFIAIVDVDVYGNNVLEKVKNIIKTHKPDIMLRAKSLKGKAFYEYAKTLRNITYDFGLRLLINERFDIAIGVDADGVHMPSNAIDIEILKSIYKGIIGYSAHSKQDAILAKHKGAHYITLSPIFHTKSHEETKPLGLDYLKDVVKSINIPVFALGGISKDNINSVLETGVYGVASIRMFL